MYENKNINIYNVISFIAFSYILVIAIYLDIKSSNFLYNLNKLFLIFFIPSCLIGILLKIPDAPHFVVVFQIFYFLNIKTMIQQGMVLSTCLFRIYLQEKFTFSNDSTRRYMLWFLHTF